MYQGVPHSTERRVSTTSKLGAEPGEEGQGAVVDNMEGGEVVILLAKKEEERVKEVNEL